MISIGRRYCGRRGRVNPGSVLGCWEKDGKKHPESIGTSLRRITYHYWYHLGESQAIRQMIGHRDLPAFVGNINSAPYAPEAAG